MKPDTLHIVTVISNPIRWQSRIRLALAAVEDWLREPNVHVTIVECAQGSRDYDLEALAAHPRVSHVPVRATTLVWNKESLLGIGISRLPHDAKYIGTFDADIHFRKPGWATETIHALQIFPIVQPWGAAYDLGPNDEHVQTHVSFCRLFHEGHPVTPNGNRWWKFQGGPYDYAHSGFAWSYTRDILDKIGGLIDFAGMGSADHHMALALVGAAEKSMPVGTHPNYVADIMSWQHRAMSHVNRKIGFVPGTIEHRHHGPKQARGYTSRWGMFVGHQFDPRKDIKRNTFGVVEWAGNKPELEREWHLYLKARIEDANVIA